jgi:hypothetical protein
LSNNENSNNIENNSTVQVEDPENKVSANTFKSEDFQTRRTTRNTDIIGDMSRPEIAKRKTHYINEHGEQVYPPWSPFTGYPYDKDELLIMKEQANKPPEAGTAQAAGRDHYATWNGMAYHQAMAEEDLDKVLERLQIKSEDVERTQIMQTLPLMTSMTKAATIFILHVLRYEALSKCSKDTKRKWTK